MDEKVTKFESYLTSALDYLASSALLLALLAGALYLMNVVVFGHILGFEWTRCNGVSAVSTLLVANLYIAIARHQHRGRMLRDPISFSMVRMLLSPIARIIEALVMVALALVMGCIMNVASHYFGI